MCSRISSSATLHLPSLCKRAISQMTDHLQVVRTAPAPTQELRSAYTGEAASWSRHSCGVAEAAVERGTKVWLNFARKVALDSSSPGGVRLVVAHNTGVDLFEGKPFHEHEIDPWAGHVAMLTGREGDPIASYELSNPVNGGMVVRFPRRDVLETLPVDVRNKISTHAILEAGRDGNTTGLGEYYKYVETYYIACLLKGQGTPLRRLLGVVPSSADRDSVICDLMREANPSRDDAIEALWRVDGLDAETAERFYKIVTYRLRTPADISDSDLSYDSEYSDTDDAYEHASRTLLDAPYLSDQAAAQALAKQPPLPWVATAAAASRIFWDLETPIYDDLADLIAEYYTPV